VPTKGPGEAHAALPGHLAVGDQRGEGSALEQRHDEKAKSLAVRGELLPGEYPYREDAMQLWAALHDLAEARVRAWYPDNAAIAEDEELMAWSYYCSRTIRGFPSPISTASALTDALTSAMYSVLLHQVHNAPAADHTIVPGKLASLASTIRGVRLPRFRGDGPTDLWKHASLGNVVITLLFDATLTAYNKRVNMVFELGKYCQTDAERQSVAAFKQACEAISKNIASANAKGRRLKFDHLDPIRYSSQSVAS